MMCSLPFERIDFDIGLLRWRHAIQHLDGETQHENTFIDQCITMAFRRRVLGGKNILHKSLF